MSAERPNARKAAAARNRSRRRRERVLPVLIPVVVIALAGVIAFVIASGGGSDEPPAPGSPEQLALGEEVFADNCQTCHGPEARGGLAGPPLVHEMYQDLTDDDIRTVIAQGKAPENWEFAAMPPIPGLDDSEVAAVIAYVRQQQAEAWGEDP